MPNWCHNWLTVEGDGQSVKTFVERVRESKAEARRFYDEALFVGQDGKQEEKPPFDEWYAKRGDVQPLTFQRHAPIPDDIDAAIEHWGTKWDASFGGAFMGIGEEGMDMEASRESSGVQLFTGNGEGSKAVYKFDTAWSPPIPWLVQCSALERELSFVLRWADASSDTHMEHRFVGGLLVDEQTLEWDDVPKEMRWF